MADPLLDEDGIVQDLMLPVVPASVARLQMAAVAAMCDLYDRKVTRENYVAMLGPCISMYGAMAKLYMMNNVRVSFRKGDVNEENINTAIAALEDNARSHVANVRQIMKDVMECPTSADPIQ